MSAVLYPENDTHTNYANHRASLRMRAAEANNNKEKKDVTTDNPVNNNAAVLKTPPAKVSQLVKQLQHYNNHKLKKTCQF